MIAALCMGGQVSHTSQRAGDMIQSAATEVMGSGPFRAAVRCPSPHGQDTRSGYVL